MNIIFLFFAAPTWANYFANLRRKGFFRHHHKEPNVILQKPHSQTAHSVHQQQMPNTGCPCGRMLDRKIARLHLTDVSDKFSVDDFLRTLGYN